MAVFRKIHVSFWSDTFIQELDTEHKLFYLYLLTNERTKQCGIYEISKKQISFDLNFSLDKVSKFLKYFVETGKIKYSENTKELALKNWYRFNGSTSPKVVSCIKSELNKVKDRVLIEYIYSIDTLSQEEKEEEKEVVQLELNIVDKKKVNDEKIDFDILLGFIKDKFSRNFKFINDKTKKQFNARLKEGYVKEDIMNCIINLKNNLYHKENGYQYCTPEFISRQSTLEKYSDKVIVKNNNVYIPTQELN